jgi:hypothetical protein
MELITLKRLVGDGDSIKEHVKDIVVKGWWNGSSSRLLV